MNAAFEHIEQVRYLLSRIFESGFSSCTNLSNDINILKNQAEELALNAGVDLLGKLNSELFALRAGQGGVNYCALIYSNLISYYQMTSDMLILETMSVNVNGEGF